MIFNSGNGKVSGGGSLDLIRVLEGSVTSFTNSDVEKLRNRALSDCPSLTDVSLPNLITAGKGAFISNTSLVNVSLPKCKNLDDQTFYYDSAFNPSIKDAFPLLEWAGAECFRQTGLEEFVSFTVEYIGSNALRSGHLELVVIPNGGMRGACYGETHLTTVDMGWGWNGDWRYDNAYPNKIKGVAASCFEGCTAFDTLILRDTTMCPLANISAFNNTPFKSGGTGGTLYVPNSLKSSYQGATNWSTILGYTNNQIKSIENSIYETQYADGTPIA